MGWTDVIDGLNDFMPRRWKRKLGVGLVVCALLFPTQVQTALVWYGQQKVAELSERIMPLLTAALTPTPEPKPDTDR